MNIRIFLVAISGILIFVVGGMILYRTRNAFYFTTDQGYLRSLGELGKQTWFRIGFFLHVFAAIPVLLLAWIQLLGFIRKKWAAFHRWTGRVYVVLTLFAAVPGGMVLSSGAAGGIPGKIIFFTMCVLWFVFTFRGWIRIRRNKTNAHRADMIRSFSLAFGAITLRLWMFVIGGLLEWRTPGAYALCALLSWVPNLLVAECMVFFYSKKFSLK